MVKIKRIGVLSMGKIYGMLCAIMGLIFGAIMTLVSLVGLAISSSSTGMFGVLFGVGAIIFLPIVYGVMGFIMGLITALLYNLIASWVGGLEVETE